MDDDAVLLKRLHGLSCGPIPWPTMSADTGSAIARRISHEQYQALGSNLVRLATVPTIALQHSAQVLPKTQASDRGRAGTCTDHILEVGRSLRLKYYARLIQDKRRDGESHDQSSPLLLKPPAPNGGLRIHVPMA